MMAEDGPSSKQIWYTTSDNQPITNNFLSGATSEYNNDLGVWVATFKNDVTTIERTAFFNCGALTSINLPASVTTIEQTAFFRCGALTSINLPASVTTIGENAFFDCGALTSVTINSQKTLNATSSSLDYNFGSQVEEVILQGDITTIPEGKFYYMKNLQRVTLSASVTSIENHAFEFCSSLASITSYATNPPSVGKDAFQGVTKSIPVYVPNGCVDNYQAADGWKEFTNITVITIPRDSYSLTDQTDYAEIFRSQVGEFTYTRTFSESQVNKWQALYVPFSMSYDDWKENFDVAAINMFHEYTDLNGETVKTELEVRLVKKGSLKPNHPYLIRAKNGEVSEINLTSCMLYESEENSIVCSSVETKYTFTGIYHSIDQLKTNGYIFMSGGKLCKAADDEVALSPQRWYLKIENLGSQIDDTNPNNSNAKALSFDIKVIEDDDATGIDEITVSRTPISEYGKTVSARDGLFNLNGMRVNEDYKGIVIKNGKKYIMK